jgi:hypothetical protein
VGHKNLCHLACGKVLANSTPRKGTKSTNARAETLGPNNQIQISTLKGFLPHLTPNVPFVIIDAMRFEKSSILILKRHAFVMFFLVFDVPNDFCKI